MAIVVSNVDASAIRRQRNARDHARRTAVPLRRREARAITTPQPSLAAASILARSAASDDESRDLWFHYVTLLADVHAPQTLPIVRKIAPKMM